MNEDKCIGCGVELIDKEKHQCPEHPDEYPYCAACIDAHMFEEDCKSRE